jgi:hypothetical protein
VIEVFERFRERKGTVPRLKNAGRAQATPERAAHGDHRGGAIGGSRHHVADRGGFVSRSRDFEE